MRLEPLPYDPRATATKALQFAALDPALNKPKPMPKLAGYGYVEVAGVRYANSWVPAGRTIRLEL